MKEPLELSKATIKEAAELAGVSIASVSRALNNKPGISESTRKKILEVCEQLNYVPNSSARELTGSHSNTVFISMGPHDYYASRYLAMLWPALSSEMRKRGKNVLPAEWESDLSHVAGAVLLGIEDDDDPRLKQLEENNIPYVSIGCANRIFWVTPDDFNGGKMATEHLLELGHKQIGFVTPNNYGGAYQFRYQGYMFAMTSQGLSLQEFRTGAEPVCEISAYRYFMQLPKEQLERFDGFVCQCDETAIGLISALEDRGYQVPKDFGVVGYDGLPGVADQLTTVVQNPNDIANKVAEMLDSALLGEEPKGAMIPVYLRKGKTT